MSTQPEKAAQWRQMFSSCGGRGVRRGRGPGGDPASSALSPQSPGARAAGTCTPRVQGPLSTVNNLVRFGAALTTAGG